MTSQTYSATWPLEPAAATAAAAAAANDALDPAMAHAAVAFDEKPANLEAVDGAAHNKAAAITDTSATSDGEPLPDRGGHRSGDGAHPDFTTDLSAPAALRAARRPEDGTDGFSGGSISVQEADEWLQVAGRGVGNGVGNSGGDDDDDSRSRGAAVVLSVDEVSRDGLTKSLQSRLLSRVGRHPVRFLVVAGGGSAADVDCMRPPAAAAATFTSEQPDAGHRAGALTLSWMTRLAEKLNVHM